VLIDWFTVAAQIVNFLILVGLMKHFLYGPLLHAIDAREQRVAGQLKEAENRNKDAEAKAEQLQARIREVENRSEQIVEDARKEADRQKAELVQAARESVRALDARWREDLHREQAACFEEIRRAAGCVLVTIARKALADLAGVDLQRGAALAFVERMKSFDGAALKKVCGGMGATVVSATELSADLREQIQQVLESRMRAPVNLRFETAPELGWGVELRGEGQRIGWTPNTYLDALEEKLNAVLEERAEAGSPLAAA
jgi:F-type H+-transporting ATPase subunit b